jgi:PIN domain nuclease of toxin-antitoxin system
MASRAVLLDTCAVIWLANGEAMLPGAIDAIVQAGLAEGAFVSPISAWEVGLLSRPRAGGRIAKEFLPDPKTWFARLMAGAGIKSAPLTPEIAIDACFLPGELHGDPADRLLLATARYLRVPIVTRDRQILAYARRGDVRAIRC